MNLIFVLFCHLAFAMYSLTCSGSFMLHVRATCFKDCILDLMVSSARPSLCWLNMKFVMSCVEPMQVLEVSMQVSSYLPRLRPHREALD